MTIPDSPALDLDRLSYEIEACAPEFERRSLPYNQSGLTLATLARELLAGTTRLRDDLTAARAERDRALQAFRTQQAEAQRLSGKVTSLYDVASNYQRQRDEAREQAKQAQAELADADAALRRLGDQANHLVQQVNGARHARHRIADAHHKHVDGHGGTWGECNECGNAWPCPTYVWATTDRDPLATWDPADDATPTAAPKADDWRGQQATDCGRGVAGDWCRRPVDHEGDCSPKSRKLALPAAAPDPAPRCCPNHREPGEARYGCATAPGVTDPCCNECHYWVAWTRYLDGHDDEDADPVPAGGEDGSGTADGAVAR